MRWSATAGAWTRGDTLLAAVTAAIAAGAALSDPLDVPWLKTAGLVAAGVGATALVIVKLGRIRLEAGRERAESNRRLRIPVTPIGRVDPTLIGVDRAAQTVLPGGERPRYLPRPGADAALRVGLAKAIAGGRWLLVVVGPSKVGKSRTLFEALCALATEPVRADYRGAVQVVAPVDTDSLKALLIPGQRPRLRAGPVVLWLDDLEPFLNQGMTWQTLQEWHNSGRWERGQVRLVVATYGGKGSDHITGAVTTGLATTANEILQHALEIPLSATTAAEEAALPGISEQEEPATLPAEGGGFMPAPPALGAEQLAAIRQSGLAAFLVAGPALERKLATGRHAPGHAPCPEGVAAAAVVIDWARCGRTDPLNNTLLRQLWPDYVPAGTATTDTALNTGLAWALQPVAGAVALISGTESYTAYDYVVRLRLHHSDMLAPDDRVWDAAITTANPTQAAAVAIAAYRADRLDDAALAFTRAREATSPDLAARAGFNLGVVLGELGRSEEAVAVYRQVAADYVADPTQELRARVAKTLVNQGVQLRVLGRTEEALEVFGRVVTDYASDPASALRVQVMRAREALREAGRTE